MNSIRMSQPREGRAVAAVAVALSLTLGAGCEVTNPGPVADEYLTLPAAQQGFVNGSKERLTRVVGNGAYSSSLIARELFPGGQTGSYGFSIQNQAGSMGWNSGGEYNNAQQARWIAESAITKFAEQGDVPVLIRTQAYVYAGYANRILGEHWCEAVFDGGPIEPGTKYFERAEKHFTDALAIATDAAWKNAAYAGRAQVRLWMKNYTGAMADAALVPDSYVLLQEMDIAGGNTSQRNHIYFGTASAPYRSVSVRYTYYDQYYTDTGDPRTPWIEYVPTNDKLCVGSLQGLGRVPCIRQWKYKSENDDMKIASGREMRLVEAEALLSTPTPATPSAANIAAALAKINGIRTVIKSDKAGNPFLTPWTATTAAEAWTVLMRERGIELWLEHRRSADQRRWSPLIGQMANPGNMELPNFEARSTVFTLYPRGRPVTEGNEAIRTTCYNVPDGEANTNENIPDR